MPLFGEITPNIDQNIFLDVIKKSFSFRIFFDFWRRWAARRQKSKKMQSFAFFSIFGGGAQHAAKNRKKCFRFSFFSIFGGGAQHAAKNRKKCFRSAFDRNGGAPPGRGRRRTGPHRFDQMLERTAEQTNERTNERKTNGSVAFVTVN